MKKAALHNLGCKVNSYETQSMEEMLKNAGYEIVDFEKDIADVYIINTCSVTNMADRKSRQMLHRAKKMNPDAIVIAAGCYVQAAGEEVLKDAAVDIVVGNNKKIDIVSVIEEYEADHNIRNNVIDIASEREYENLEVETDSEHTRAFIKVQDGCNQFCTYCIIPYVRGRIRSRKVSDVISEIRKLALNGYREVVLTGIHLSSYGLDFDENNRVGLIDLIEAVNGIDGIDRIRLGSLEPRIVTEDFTRRLSKLKKICPHFHLSLQSGCDETLKRMNRRYTTEEYENGCNILRKYFDNPAVTTDVIVGFPDESEEEFNKTVDFLKKIHFYEMHVFKYSRRKGTVADRMPGQIPDNIKNSRSDILIGLNREMSDEYRESFIGNSLLVLFEEEMVIDFEKYFIGHTDTYIKVAVKTEEKITNRIFNVLIEGRLSGDIMYGVIQ